MAFRKVKILFALLFSVLINFSVSYANSFDQKVIDQYSDDLELILQSAHKQFDVNEIFIGGGTARSLILSMLQGKPFVFRDFDLVFSANRTVTEERTRAFGLELEKMQLGKFSQENLRPRPRYNPALDPIEARGYNAGFGFFVHSSQGVEYDISVYHSPEALNLNGIMDVDKFQIRLKIGESLRTLVRNSQRFRAAIVDPANALSKLLENRPPTVANWHEVSKSPAMTSIRVVRTLAKFAALPLDEFTQQKFRALIAQEATPDVLQISRNLLKLFEDSLWAQEFRALVEMGLFGNQFRSFAAAVNDPGFFQATSLEEKVVRLLKHANKDDALLFLKLLNKLEPELIQKVLPQVVAEKKLRVGYFSGEFAPFHRGHEGVVRTALSHGGLDLIFVIAVPHITNGPKTAKFSPSEWAERRAFVDAGIKALPQAWIWPLPAADKEAELRLDAMVRDIDHFLGNSAKPLTHVFGMDSYHRVLGRGLVDKDPRPRIAVTREGVAMPQENLNVRVLQNVERRPISASRLLQEVAVTGASSFVAPEVLKLVLATPRYQVILNDNRQLEKEVDTRVGGTRKYDIKTLYWDIRENHAGLWTNILPPFSEMHRNLLDQLLSLGAKKIVVPMYNNTPEDLAAMETWKKALKSYATSVIEIRRESIYDGVPENQKVNIFHSGVLNERLKKGEFDAYLRAPRGLIIFETPDQPVSPIFKGSRKIMVIQSEPSRGNRCESIFQAG
jgi:nicotinamide mononucleotide adenylyltransferase